MSFQITILKVLAGQPGGRAALADLTRDVGILTSSGADWSQRMKRLAARAPNLDIFGQGFVLRNGAGWQITNAGCEFLKLIEAASTTEPLVELAALPPVLATSSVRPSNVIRLTGQRAGRRRAAA